MNAFKMIQRRKPIVRFSTTTMTPAEDLEAKRRAKKMQSRIAHLTERLRFRKQLREFITGEPSVSPPTKKGVHIQQRGLKVFTRSERK